MTSRNGGASTVNGHDDAADSVSGTHVRVDRSGVRQVVAGTAEIDRAGIQALHADEARIERSMVGTVRAERVTLRDSSVGAIAGRSVASDGSRAGVLAALVVRGDVQTWFDLRTAFAVGLGFATGSLALSLLRGAARRARS